MSLYWSKLDTAFFKKTNSLLRLSLNVLNQKTQAQHYGLFCALFSSCKVLMRMKQTYLGSPGPFLCISIFADPKEELQERETPLVTLLPL